MGEESAGELTVHAGGWIVAGGCAYELGALATGRWRTITHLVHDHRRLPGVELAVWACLFWLGWHLLFKGR